MSEAKICDRCNKARKTTEADGWSEARVGTSCWPVDGGWQGDLCAECRRQVLMCLRGRDVQ